MSHRLTRFARPLAAVAVTLTLAACGQSASSPAPGNSSPTAAAVQVVAATNVYSNVASVIGGDRVKVTSIIDDPERDPHEYEADAQNQLALSKAQLVIENGGGYDDFVDTMLKAAPRSDGKIINVAKVSGYNQEPADGEFNEHLWYDFPTMAKVTDQLVVDLSALDSQHAEAFKANGASFKLKLQTLIEKEAAIKKTHAGDGVAITEPVPLYMLEAAGLTNKTPDEFSEAIEEDTDVPPAVLSQTLNLFSEKKVQLLAYNQQTGGPQTDKVLAAAKQANVPAVAVTETLPTGKDYISWMTDNLTGIERALQD